MPSGSIAPNADVADSAMVAETARIWDLAQVRENAIIGENVIVGRGAYIGSGVSVGDNCKIQNYALVYEPATLAAGVFIGPAVVLTNDQFPRAINPDGTQKTAQHWEPVGVDVREGASIGASATCVAPVVIGRWALVGSGSVVIDDVPDFAIVVGSPARRTGWAGKAGHPLSQAEPGIWVCPVTGSRYREVAPDSLEAVDENA